MDERARSKRKLQEIQEPGEDESDNQEDIEGIERERPGEGLKKALATASKKQKVADNENEDEEQEIEEVPEPKADEKKAEKLLRKQEKKLAKNLKKAEKKEAKKTTQAEKSAKSSGNAEEVPVADEDEETSRAASAADDISDIGDVAGSSDLQPIDISGIEQEAEDHNSASSLASQPLSPTFDDAVSHSNAAGNEAASTATSISSTIAPEKPKQIKVPADTSALRARLAARIEALRAARKADGPDGKPIRTRQELIEARRIKQTQRKAHKKELRRQAKIAEEEKREDALKSNSPSVMSPSLELGDEPTNLSFGKVMFESGEKLSHDLSYVLTGNKKKGPSDAKTALLKVQNQKKRLAAMDETKRKEIDEKETWLTARRRAEGEKVRDDETILKKAVKRKEKAKNKSEREWKERARGVETSMRDRQRKREENIRKRKEDKILGKSGKKKSATKKKARPGFEGRSFGGGGKKK
jgi:hypothetical protein